MPEVFIHMADRKIVNRAALKKFFDGLTDGRYLLKAERKNKRTLNQNAYMHAVLIPCFREALNQAGYDEIRTDEDAKLVMKGLFLKTQVVNHETGEVIEFVKDTHKLSTVEMGELFEDVWRFAASNLNYTIPSPGETTTMNF